MCVRKASRGYVAAVLADPATKPAHVQELPSAVHVCAVPTYYSIRWSDPTCKQPLWVAEFDARLATEHQVLDCVVDSHLDGALRHHLQDRGSVACISAPGFQRVTATGTPLHVDRCGPTDQRHLAAPGARKGWERAFPEAAQRAVRPHALHCRPDGRVRCICHHLASGGCHGQSACWYWKARLLSRRHCQDAICDLHPVSA